VGGVEVVKMLDGLKRKAGLAVLGTALKSIASSPDTRTTVAGILAAAAIAVPGFDLGRLISGDLQQLAHVTAALTVAAIGYWATKAKRDGATTAAGAIGGMLYACSGQISDIIIAAILMFGGYVTNKRAAVVPRNP
jgi:Ca2+/H+ antiporter